MSGGMEASQAEQDLKTLEAFLVGNEDLDRLEALLDRFNIFEAIGMVSRELNHSQFLAYLLDPSNNHGLGDLFVKRLLQNILSIADEGEGRVLMPISAIELELWDLERMTVEREWHHVDILLRDVEHRLVVVIENKIKSGEHSDQLQRYLDIVEAHHAGWRIVPLFLTPDGSLPSHESYLAVDYSLVSEIIDAVAESRAAVVNPDVKTLMTHYTEMLRRQIVNDSQVAELCRQIYQQHRRAIDLIYKHRPDIQTDLRPELEALVQEVPHLVADHSAKQRIRFSVEGWDAPALLTANWTPSGRILLFEFFNRPEDLQLKLMVGPSKPGKEDVRQRIFDMATANPEVLQRPHRTDGDWGEIYSRRFLDRRLYGTEVNDAERTEEIRRHWNEFLQEDLPRIDNALKEEKWIWEPEEPD
jgi:hypothetical protein